MKTAFHALTFTVHDIPVGQGSKRYVGKRMIDVNHERLRSWREAVKQSALAALAELGHAEDIRLPLFDRGEPVRVNVVFTFGRPQNHYGTGRNSDRLRDNAPADHTHAPDIDKLARGLLDSLTAAGVWSDDKQCAQLLARKEWTNPRMTVPGATVRVSGGRP